MTPGLPSNERRRKYFLTLVEEASLLFNIPKSEATLFAERFTLFVSTKVALKDSINFGDGAFIPKVLPPRPFNLITSGHVGNRKRTHYGERVRWKLNLFKRARQRARETT